jgi:hypothetical protein
VAVSRPAPAHHHHVGADSGFYELVRDPLGDHPIPETHFRWVEFDPIARYMATYLWGDDPLADYSPDWRERR